MPDEKLIEELENIFSEVITLGGMRENTKIVPNMLVRDASPTDLSGFVIIADDRDNDNILAKTVPGVIYSDNDLVNVIFTKGGEAIAFQQGSQSASSGLWSIVPSTTTDIYYNSGDVGIGKAVAPDARLEILDTAQAQLRLTYQEDTKYVTFTLDTNHDLTIKPTSTGQIILQPTTDSIDFFQVLDADGGTPVLNVDSTNERVGIGNAAPTTPLDVTGTVTITDNIVHAGDPDTYFAFTDNRIDLLTGGTTVLTLTASSVLAEVDLLVSSGTQDYLFGGSGSDFAIQGQTSGADSGMGYYTKDGDGTDNINMTLYMLGTPGNITNRERLLIRGVAATSFSISTDANGTGTLRPLILQTGTNTNQLVLATDGNTGISNAGGAPLVALEVGDANPTFGAVEPANAVSALIGGDTVGRLYIEGSVLADIILDDSGGTANQQLFQIINAGGLTKWRLLNDDGSIAVDNVLSVTNSNGYLGIGVATASAKLHVDQSSTTAAIPVAYFDQADVSEEMFEFNTTIGTGNAIEAVGAKTLTTTHFIKVTLPGGLTRYFPVGTIA